MYFVGLDLAWGDKNQTGVAVHRRRRPAAPHRRGAGRRRASSTSIGPLSAATAWWPSMRRSIVKNPTGYRRGENGTQPGLSAIRSRRPPGVHRATLVRAPRGAVGAALGSRHGSCVASNRRAIEVYPHPATSSLSTRRDPEVQAPKKDPVKSQDGTAENSWATSRTSRRTRRAPRTEPGLVRVAREDRRGDSAVRTEPRRRSYGRRGVRSTSPCTRRGVPPTSRSTGIRHGLHRHTENAKPFSRLGAAHRLPQRLHLSMNRCSTGG